MGNNLCNRVSLWLNTCAIRSTLSQLSEVSAQKRLKDLWHTYAGNWALGVEKKKIVVLRERKVLSQGRMLGYLFFSLLASLLASSYVPLALPPGKNYNMKTELDCTSYWGGLAGPVTCSTACKALSLPLPPTGTHPPLKAKNFNFLCAV